jgi:hypothetical protein
LNFGWKYRNVSGLTVGRLLESSWTGKLADRTWEDYLLVGGWKSKRGRLAIDEVAKRATPLSIVANFIFASEMKCNFVFKAEQLSEKVHELCRAWLRKKEVEGLKRGKGRLEKKGRVGFLLKSKERPSLTLCLSARK